MPTTRCLDCGSLTRLPSRCSSCKKKLKAVRNAVAPIARQFRDAGGVCAICGERSTANDPLSADHIIPRSHGGGNALDNLQPAHLSCNKRKQDRY